MNRNRGLAWFGALALIVAAGCGGGGGEDAGRSRPAPSRPAAAGDETAAPAAADSGAMGTASVKGSVTFEGEAPKAKKIRMDADAFCQKAHTGDTFSEEVVLNENGTLRWVFVYVKSGLSGSYPTPTESVVLDQHGCTYMPHVLGVQTGQPLKILNSDETLHNIHSLAKNNPQFNIAMPKYVKEKEQTFENVEIMAPVKCDVHSWMATYIGVLDHPFFSVTGTEGAFDLSGLPAGTYTIEAWHEKYGTQTQEVTVADGETSEISFSFSAS